MPRQSTTLRSHPATDELNLVKQGQRYGWPGCFGLKQDCNQEKPKFALQMHSSANGLMVYEGQQFPASLHGAIFMAEFGTSVADNRFDGNGHRLVYVHPDQAPASIDPNDTHAGQEEVFASGFGRPIDVLMANDGAMFVLDFEKSAIFKLIPVEQDPRDPSLCAVQRDGSGAATNLFAPAPQSFSCDESQGRICNNAVGHGACDASGAFQCQCIDKTSWWVQCEPAERAAACQL